MGSGATRCRRDLAQILDNREARTFGLRREHLERHVMILSDRHLAGRAVHRNAFKSIDQRFAVDRA